MASKLLRLEIIAKHSVREKIYSNSYDTASYAQYHHYNSFSNYRTNSSIIIIYIFSHCLIDSLQACKL